MDNDDSFFDRYSQTIFSNDRAALVARDVKPVNTAITRLIRSIFYILCPRRKFFNVSKFHSIYLYSVLRSFLTRHTLLNLSSDVFSTVIVDFRSPTVRLK